MAELRIGNPLAAYAGGMEIGRRQQANTLLQKYGAAAMQGDQTALNALAGNPLTMEVASRALERKADADYRQKMLGFSQNADKRAQQNHDAQIAQWAAQASEKEKQEALANLENTARMVYSVQDPETWDRLAAENGADEWVGRFGDKDALLSQFMSWSDIIKQGAPQRPEYGFDNGHFYDKNDPAAGAKPIPGMPAGGDGMEIVTDGFTFRQGAGVGTRPTGQSAVTTNTPRDPGKMATKLSEADVAALEEMGGAARSATELRSLGNQLGVVSEKVGYTGPGGAAVGLVDDVVGFLPGDSGARGAFKSLAMEAQLSFTEKTKGAITDREMGMFKAAVPGLTQTEEGNQMIAGVMQAGAQRIESRDAFYQNWARKHGSLEGANEVWAEYMAANPIIRGDGDGIAINEEGDWRSYLNRMPAHSYTPQAIMQMDSSALAQVPIESMTGPQLDALERRFMELEGGQ